MSDNLITSANNVISFLRQMLPHLSDRQLALTSAQSVESAINGLVSPLVAATHRDPLDAYKSTPLTMEELKACKDVIDVVWQGLLVAAALPMEKLDAAPAATAMVRVLTGIWKNAHWPVEARVHAGELTFGFIADINPAKVYARQTILQFWNEENLGPRTNAGDIYEKLYAKQREVEPA